MHFLISALLAFSMSILPAKAGAMDDLKAVFDDLNYSLEVEWDQKDEEFYFNQLARFNIRLNDLKSQGLTNEEIVAFALDSIKDKNAARELENLFGLMSMNDLTEIQAQEMIEFYISKHSSQGASWNGRAALIGGGIVIVVVSAMVVSGYDFTHRLTRGTKS